jgi:hypothetical protein
MRVLTGSGLIVLLLLTGCGSEAESAPEGADVAADVGGSGDSAGSGSADTGSSDTGSSDTEVADTGSADTEVADTTPPPSCGRVETTGSDRATYDIILPLFERAATAEVTLDGSGLTVLP